MWLMICLQVENKTVNLFFCAPASGPLCMYKEKVCLVRAAHSGMCVFVCEEEEEEEREHGNNQESKYFIFIAPCHYKCISALMLV